MYNQADPRGITPRGWLRRQLEIQADGLSGNLDKIWPDVADSAWIGGSREGWERVPYWLDGFIPLAFLLGDEDKIQRADRYIRAILQRQEPDGWLCPCPPDKRGEYDIWALFLMGKVLALYWEFTRREEVLDGLDRAMRCLYALMESGAVRLHGWGKFRWFECMIPLRLLQQERPAAWISRLALMLAEQGADYPSFSDRWTRPMNRWTMETHIVNLAMMLKYEAVASALTGAPYQNQAESLWRCLETYNGTAAGTFSGDECLAGLKNNQGTELCSVAELMYSCELLYAITGDRVWADRLERIAFNALPATLSDDMWTHQYDQMVNQIACVRFPGKPYFRTNGAEAHLFGLEPNYGCCTANFNQAWPKLAMSVFLRRGDGVECALLLPAELHTRIGGANVTVSLETEYPFRHECRCTVETDAPAEFTLRLRIPGWAQTYEADGFVCGDGFCTMRKTWNGRESFVLRLHGDAHLTRRPSGLYCAEYGPLLFSVPVEAEYKKHEYVKDGVERKFPFCDYELYPRSEWRFGFAGETLQVCETAGDGVPFSSRKPSLTLTAPLCRVAWEYEDGYDSVAAALPAGGEPLSPPQTTVLYPYGCAKLRMTELPLCAAAAPERP